jgi:hypothetical protein
LIVSQTEELRSGDMPRTHCGKEMGSNPKFPTSQQSRPSLSGQKLCGGGGIIVDCETKLRFS